MKKILNNQRLLTGLWLLVMVSVFGIQSNAQDQVIGTFPSMQGGFEKFETGNLGVNLISSGTTTTAWTVSASASATFSINASTARTGSRFLQLGSTASNARRWQTPTAPDGNTAAGIQNGTTYIIQYYYRTSGTTDITNLAAQLTTDGGTGGASTGTAPMTATNGVWTKAVVSITASTTSTANPRYGVGGLRANPGTTVNVDVDDYVVYEGTEVDGTAPDESTVFAATPASNQIGVSWTAPATGVDGGGYLVVRHTSDPATAPNVNGIYAVGNSIGSGTVVYIGTATSFTDTGLASTTPYYYRVYTVDKAFNYSDALTGNATTTAAGYDDEPTAQVTDLNFTSVSTSGMTINWTPAVSGGGTNHLVVIGTSLSGEPADGSSYTANTDFGNVGSSTVAGGKVVYNGTENSVTVTGLNYNTTYYVRVYDFNGSAGTENYLTTSPTSGSQMTERRTITSTVSGSWGTAGTWSPAVVPGQHDNVVIQDSHVVTFSGASANACYNLDINTGGQLYNISGSPTYTIGYIGIYGTSLIVNGTLGDAVTEYVTGIQFNQNCTLSGSGTIRINRMRPYATASNATFTFNADATLTNSNATMMCDNPGSSNIGYKINSDRTVTSQGFLTGGNANTTNAANGCTFIVDGTLNVNNAIYLNAASGQTASLIVNGTLNILSFKGSGNAAGAIPTTTVNGSGLIKVTGTNATADFSNPATSGNVTGTGAFTLDAGATYLIGGTDGLNPTTGSIRCTTRNFNAAANYSFVGTSAQVPGSDFPATANNLTINNAAGVSLDKQLNISNTLTLTSGLLSLGAFDLHVTSTNNINGGSATSFVVTNGAGKLYKAASAAQVVNLPVGSSSVSYDPVVLTPTDATTFNVNVGTVLPGAAASGITYNEKVWNINSSAPSSTEMKLTPSSAVATNFTDVIGHWNGSSYENIQATRTEKTYTATVSAFSPFVTGTSDASTGTIETGSAVEIAVGNNEINVRGLEAGKIVALYGLNGQLVASVSSQGNDLTIHVSKGIYLLKLHEAKSNIVHKIVVQ